MHSDAADGFALEERAYWYQDHGIYITIKEKRKRIFMPLTDNNQYTRQMCIKLFPEEGNIDLKVPVNVAVKKHDNYRARVGVAVGMSAMLVTDEGHIYGEKLGEYQNELAKWIREQTVGHDADWKAKPGRNKYTAKKRHLDERLRSYINMELNRFLKTEKAGSNLHPETAPSRKVRRKQGSQPFHHSVEKKIYQEKIGTEMRPSIRVVEVFGKGISIQCSRCKGEGTRENGVFRCSVCGYETAEKKIPRKT